MAATTTDEVPTYDVGDLVKFTFEFYEENGTTPADPDTFEVWVREPNNKIWKYVYGSDEEVARTALGKFYFLLDIKRSGDWYVRGKSIGALQAAEEYQIYVPPSQFE